MNNFNKIIDEILTEGMVEGQYIDLKSECYIKKIFKDKSIANNIYTQFMNNLKTCCEPDDMYMKVNDLIYRLDMLISKCLIKNHGLNNYDDIKNKLELLIDNNIDLYSAVSYDASDNEIIDEFEYEISEDIKI